jgi:hypothetical protein
MAQSFAVSPHLRYKARASSVKELRKVFLFLGFKKSYGFAVNLSLIAGRIRLGRVRLVASDLAQPIAE